MTTHSIVGAGQVGTRLADLLVADGHEVRQISRRGQHVPGATGMAVDASDLASLTTATEGSEVIYNCVNPAYHRWPQDWPPIAENLLRAAHGKVLVTLSNLYGYGPVTGTITADLPLTATTRKGQVRAQMWERALQAHARGDLRAVEVRGSDYIGEAGQQVTFGSRVVDNLRVGKAVTLLGRTDMPHTWTYTGDVAATLAMVATDDRAYGHAWHVPSNEPRTQAQVVADLADVLEVPLPKIRTAGPAILRAMGVVNPTMRELVEMLYEFNEPFVMDSTPAQTVFGLKPTAWETVIEQNVRANS